MERFFAFKADNMSIKINMAELKKSINANRAKDANIKVTAAQRHSATEPFGILKWDKSYKRLFRRGAKNVILELTLISCGFNLYKYYNKSQRKKLVS